MKRRLLGVLLVSVLVLLWKYNGNEHMGRTFLELALLAVFLLMLRSYLRYRALSRRRTKRTVSVPSPEKPPTELPSNLFMPERFAPLKHDSGLPINPDQDQVRRIMKATGADECDFVLTPATDRPDGFPEIIIAAIRRPKEDDLAVRFPGEFDLIRWKDRRAHAAKLYAKTKVH